MQLIQASSTDGVIDTVSATIQQWLTAGRRVIWLVSGGSLVAAEVAIMRTLSAQDCANLAIFQADERYGADGHADSNWQQLVDGGFEPGTAYAVPVLAGLSLKATTERYDRLLRAAFNADNVAVVGLFGIGADGHTAGILPESDAAQPTVDFATGYQASDFVRITVTPLVMARLDLAVAYAVGEAKTATLTQLFDADRPPTVQPAQFLKTAKRTIVYNDIRGGEA